MASTAKVLQWQGLFLCAKSFWSTMTASTRPAVPRRLTIRSTLLERLQFPEAVRIGPLGDQRALIALFS